MCLQFDVTKKNREDFSIAPRDGAYVHGLFMEGARWDTEVVIQSQICVGLRACVRASVWVCDVMCVSHPTPVCKMEHRVGGGWTRVKVRVYF